MLSAKECTITPIEGNQTFLQVWAGPTWWLKGRILRCKLNISLLGADGNIYDQILSFLGLSPTETLSRQPSNQMRLKNAPTAFESLCSSSSSQRPVILVLYASMFREPYVLRIFASGACLLGGPSGHSDRGNKLGPRPLVYPQSITKRENPGKWV